MLSDIVRSAQRYANHPQNDQINSSQLLTQRNMRQHLHTTSAETVPKEQRIEKWIDDVAEATSKNAQEDPMLNSEIGSDPLQRVHNAEDYPVDKWSGVWMKRNLQGQTPSSGMRGAWGRMSER